MKKLLYILLFLPLALFGQGDLLLNYMNCIESHEQEISSIQSQIIENNNSLVSTQTQFVEVLAYCNMCSVEEQIYDYCYSEVESIFESIFNDWYMDMISLQMELDILGSNIPCGDNPGDICMLVLCEDTYDFTTINADFDCINPEHILGSTSFCCSNYFCGMPGCKDISACNYDDNAEVDDGSCIYSIGDCVENTIDKWYLSRDLESGWNMIGYGCPSPIDVAEVLFNHTESINLVKDNNGSVYIPEFGFNGIGDFTPGLGYQIKVAEAIEGFSLCDWYSSDLVDGSVANIENENIILNYNNSNLLDSLVITQSINTDLQQDIELIILQNNILLYLVQSSNQVLEENVLLQDSLINIHNANIVSLQEENASLVDSILHLLNENCIYDGYCGFNSENNACLHAIQGYDCDGNLVPELGDSIMGGILFYYDEVLNRGLIAANDDIGQAPWGCHGLSINQLSTSIGSGYDNSVLISQQCDENPNAAELCLSYQSDGYSDWFLPSFQTLLLMWETIGQGNSNYLGNIAGFEDSAYWSSCQNGSQNGSCLYFSHSNPSGYITSNGKGTLFFVRPIRAFGNWTMGCMDETACNYNPEANMADGSCEFAEQGYDCDQVCLSDEDNDGVCYEFEVSGCDDAAACNTNLDATQDDGSCTYTELYYDCSGNCLVDADGDGVCDEQEVSGCTDSLACNFDTLATENDLSCEYAEQDYDCEGNINIQVGDEAFGGIVFYLDETGQHGLVAAMEDLDGTYEWGCNTEYVVGADGIVIGTGSQNTMDIVSQECESFNVGGGLVAALVALDHESEGYNDWYLPSRNELQEMFSTLGLGSENTSTDGFQDDYWSSTEHSTHNAWMLNSINGLGFGSKTGHHKVRPIRSF